MFFRVHSPHSLLRPFVHRFWTFESTTGFPSDDLKLIVPNGCPKLILMYRGHVDCRLGQQEWRFRENSLAAIGQTTQAAIIDPHEDFGTIGVEFKPFGAYRFFPLPLCEITNGFYPAQEVFEGVGKELLKRLLDARSDDERIALLEAFLIDNLHAFGRNVALVDHTVHEMSRHQGMVSVAVLVAESGNSKRHFDRKFKEHVGIGPKQLAETIRFQSVYNSILLQRNLLSWKLSDAYFDQSHFIKEFRRFTGMSPTTFLRKENRFAQAFFQS